MFQADLTDSTLVDLRLKAAIMHGTARRFSNPRIALHHNRLRILWNFGKTYIW